jgi:AcrR family transcriptional regulator
MERERLLRLTADYILANGIAEMSLRRLGHAIGTNNRMLLYYFGSKEQLIAEALGEAARRFPKIQTALEPLDALSTPLVDRLVECWRRIADPENVPFMRLLFEVFGIAAHQPGRFDTFLGNVGHDWTQQVTRSLRADGVPPSDAASLARELVALWRGLQFDLISTGDDDAVRRTYADAARGLAERALAAQSVR